MEPIIAPGIIYLVSLLDGLIDVGKLALLFAGLYGVTGGVATFIGLMEDDFDEDYYKAGVKRLKQAITACLILCTIGAFVPNKETAITMLVANEITEERVSKATDAGIDIYNKIVEDVKSLVTEEEEVTDKCNH